MPGISVVVSGGPRDVPGRRRGIVGTVAWSGTGRGMSGTAIGMVGERRDSIGRA